MDHLAIPVSDQERSRRFYERHCGFGRQRGTDGLETMREHSRVVRSLGT